MTCIVQCIVICLVYSEPGAVLGSVVPSVVGGCHLRYGLAPQVLAAPKGGHEGARGEVSLPQRGYSLRLQVFPVIARWVMLSVGATCDTNSSIKFSLPLVLYLTTYIKFSI